MTDWPIIFRVTAGERRLSKEVVALELSEELEHNKDVEELETDEDIEELELNEEFENEGLEPVGEMEEQQFHTDGEALEPEHFEELETDEDFAEFELDDESEFDEKLEHDEDELEHDEDVEELELDESEELEVSEQGTDSMHVFGVCKGEIVPSEATVGVLVLPE
ncbi:hypothetical protein NDU88_012899 [Pleurodeles waltl]|uniref:Uncharacterized protein n=1 Tax=Pleurodeles waltl TaxID=8319 RepID=A0AAV7R569_PLEWA|nr:hypothetical protein NDU88_012899 [Pleurodeles waltl]